MWPPPPRGEPATRFTVPVCPSTNELYVPRRDGKGRAKTSQYVSWRINAGWHVLAQKPERVPGRIAVLIEAPFSRRRDLDNIKPVLDLLSPATLKRPHGLGLIDDDRYVDDLRIVRVTGVDHMIVSIWKIPAA